MRFNIFPILIHSLIFCIQNKLIYASPLFGRNVRNVESTEYPGIAAILYMFEIDSEEQFDFQCSGIVISQQHILTASHCLEDKTIDELRFLIGSNVITTNRLHNASWWVTYSDWMEIDEEEDSINRHDIAIVKLSSPVRRHIRPAVFSTISNENLINLEINIIGWAESANNPDIINMKKARARIINNNVCKEKSLYEDAEVSEFEKRFLCSSSNPFALLNSGDSGAPMFYENKVIGLNVGVCPTTNNNMEKVNFHIGTDFYKSFIDYFINNE